MNIQEQVMGCVTLYSEQGVTLETPHQMLNRFGHTRNYFWLEASRDGRIVEGIQKGDKLLFLHTEKIEGDGYYLYLDNEKSEKFMLSYFVEKSSDILLKGGKLAKGYTIRARLINMIRNYENNLLPTNKTDE